MGKKTGVVFASVILFISIMAAVFLINFGENSHVPNSVNPPVDSSGEQNMAAELDFRELVSSTGPFAAQIDEYLEYERGLMSEGEVVFSFAGDCTLGTSPGFNPKTRFDTIYEQSGSPTYCFDLVKSFFENDDYTYINLEGALTTSEKRRNKTFNFKGDPSWAKKLIADSYIDGCNIANNHSSDWMEQGFADTKKAVLDAGMDAGYEDIPIIKPFGELEVVLLSGNYVWPERYKAKDMTALLLKEIDKYKRADNIVILNLHWGIEAATVPNRDCIDLAHEFIDAGVDLIIGNHSHTVQSIELYNDKYIFYSLGNFAFGGGQSTDRLSRNSMIVRPRFAIIEGEAVITGMSVIPCYSTSAEDLERNNYQPRPLFGKEAEALRKIFISNSRHIKDGVEELDCPTADVE